MTDPDALAAQVARLERIAAELRSPEATADMLRQLAEDALETSRRLSELLPGALAEAEEE